MPDIFISYSRRDKEFIQKLDKAFKGIQKDVWVDWEDIPPTADWWDEIKQGIDGSDNVVFIISPDSVTSEVCGRELKYAIEAQKRIVPVLHREVTDKEQQKQMNPILSAHNWIYMRATEDFDAAFTKLVDAINLDLEHAKMHTRLNTRAKEWEAKSRANDLILRGKDLDDAERWLSVGTSKIPHPNDLQAEYILASQQAEKRRQRLIIGSISVALVGAIIATIISLYLFVDARAQRKLAERQAEVSTSLALAAGSQESLSDNENDMALALALQAMTISDPPKLAPRSLADAAYAPGARQVLAGHSGWVWSADYGPDDTTIASAADQGQVFLWDAATGEIIRRFEGHEGGVNEVVFSPDGSRIMTGGDDATIRIWDVETGAEVLKIETPGDIWTVAYSPDGQKILSGSINGEVLLWDAATGEQLADLTGSDEKGGHGGRSLWVVSFSPDGQMALSGAEDNQVIIWDMTTNTARYYLKGHNQAVLDARFSHDGSTVISGSRDASLILWNMETGSQIRRFNGHKSGVGAVDFSPNSRYIISGGWDNTIILWDISNGSIVRQFYGHTGGVNRVQFSNDGQSALSASYDNTLRIWNVSGPLETFRLTQHDTAINSVTYSLDGAMFASGGVDGRVVLWNAETAEIIRDFKVSDTNAVPGGAQKDDIDVIALSPDGQYLLVGLYEPVILMWNLQTGEFITALKEHTDRVTNLAFSPDSKRVISTSADKDTTAKVWDVDPESPTFGQVLTTFSEHTARIDALTFSPDGQFALTGAYDRQIIMWDIATGEEVKRFTGHTDAVLDLEFTNDAKHFLSSSWDTTIRLWNMETGEVEMTFVGHLSGVHSISTNADDSFMVSASEDNTVRLWNLADGSEVFAFSGHSGPVREISFAPDGKHFVSGGRDNRIIVWSLPLSSNALIQWTNENRYIRHLTCDELSDYNLPCEEQS